MWNGGSGAEGGGGERYIIGVWGRGGGTGVSVGVGGMIKRRLRKKGSDQGKVRAVFRPGGGRSEVEEGGGEYALVASTT